MDLLKSLLNRQVYFPPALIDQQEAEKNRSDFDVLISLGILEQKNNPNQRPCPTCESEVLDIELVSDTRAFTLCTKDEAAGRDYFDPHELKQWSFNTPRLLSLFQKALGIEQPQVSENIEGLLWGFGTQQVNGISYQVFFCRNIDDVEKSKFSIFTSLPNSILFYTGTPHSSLPEKVLLVPLADFIEGADKEHISINQELLAQYFPQDAYQTKDGDILLDDSMTLQDEWLLIEPLRGGVFKKREKLRPFAVRLIKHLHGICKYPNHAKTQAELATALGSKKGSVANEIIRIQKVCDDNGLQALLHKYANEEWGLNSQLKCCR